MDFWEEGIALLERTRDPNVYRLGLAHQEFSIREFWPNVHPTWMPAVRGGFFNESTQEQFSIDDARQRVSGVLEEYLRHDDQEWRWCVSEKYFGYGRDPWDLRGIPHGPADRRDHEFTISGEYVPVPAGTMLWKPSLSYGPDSGIDMWLEGEHAHLFDVSYYAGYEYTANEWDFVWPGGPGWPYLTTWYKEPVASNTFTSFANSHVITVAEELREGDYSFRLHTDHGLVDCGQEGPAPQQFTVIVDKGEPTVPLAPRDVPEDVRADEHPEGWDDNLIR